MRFNLSVFNPAIEIDQAVAEYKRHWFLGSNLILLGEGRILWLLY